MRNFKLVVEYDGSGFAGWQIQPGRPTIQGSLSEAIGRMTGFETTVLGAGRTDAGVHAEGQVATFRSPTALSTGRLLSGLNALTPDAIGVRSVEVVDLGFDPTRSALGKVYRYDLSCEPVRPALDGGRTWWLAGPLDAAAMRREGRSLLGRRDFASFQGADSPRATTVRDLFLLDVEDRGPRISIRVGAGGFLYKMVRNIVGTLVEVGRGKRPAGWVAEVLDAGDRRRAGRTAPPEGLHLERVLYRW